MIKFKFKRNWLGQQVLWIEDRYADEFPGQYVYYWKRATQDDVVKFQVEVEMLREKITLINNLKETNPEIFI